MQRRRFDYKSWLRAFHEEILAIYSQPSDAALALKQQASGMALFVLATECPQ
jgi:hypothetical protein